MEFTIKSGSPEKQRSACVVVGVFDNRKLSLSAELIDRASQLTLTAPEMTVLVGGMRALGANHRDTKVGILVENAGALTNEWFVNLLDMSVEWKKSDERDGLYVGSDRKSGAPKWTASSVDLVFGSNSQLRALAEVYASDDAGRKFVDDFVAAWVKVMDLDRFELKAPALAGGRGR
ncbi:MAG: hypothetical protein F9K47_17355 [Burkholderiales bacterium]|nr:MAG: hypothetical protein F9K47_17355 [Burkholderiales bacterium]